MCDAAYVLQVEALAAQMYGASAALLRGGNAEALNLPSEVRERFDADLVAGSKGAPDSSVAALRKELGVA